MKAAPISQNTEVQLNIIVVGESGVGKSSLCKRFSGENKSVFGSTVIASSWQKTIVVNDVKVKLLICDTGGQEAYRGTITSYFNKKDGVLAVYDVTNKDTFQKLSYWLDLVRKYNSDFVPLLVGNKTDYSRERSVKPCDVAKFGKENGLAFMETSAKDGNNVEKVFEYLVLKLFLKKKILSVDKLNKISSTLLLYESPVFRHNSQTKWAEDNSEASSDYVIEKDPTQLQNIPVIAYPQKTPVSAEPVPCPASSSNDETEQITNFHFAEEANEYEAVGESDTVSAEPVQRPPSSPNDAIEKITRSHSTEGTSMEETYEYEAVSKDGAYIAESSMSNGLPPIVPLTNDEIVELYVQRERRLSTNSISSLANWDSSLAAEYRQAIEQYEEARAEIARKEVARRKRKESDCILC